MRNSSPDYQEMIDHEASGWLVRIEENGLDRHAQADFEAWLANDPSHERTYDQMRLTWNDLAGLDDLAGLVAFPDRTSEPAPNPRPVRRWTTAATACGTVAALLIAIATTPGHLLSPHPRYATQIAETRIVTLPDGSSVTLGARSSISVRFTKVERRIVLAGGQAFFDVVHKAARPFVVEAGSSVVRDIGTKFDVNLSQDTVRVSVLEGTVQVRRTNAATKDRPQLLRAGQQTEVALILPVRGAVAAAAQPIMAQQATGAWREGRLVFNNVRLNDLAADVNRYYAPQIKLASLDIGDLRVTASFKTNEIPAFMTALSATLPVKAAQDSRGSFTVSDARH